jgi:stage II sporulation protein D
MKILKLFIIFLISVNSTLISGQVKVRLFANQTPQSAIFSVTEGRYKVDCFTGIPLIINQGEIILVSRYNGKLLVKRQNDLGFICDSVSFSGQSDSFYLRLNGKLPAKQFYTGDLKCLPDFGTLLLINTCDIEKYIAGVVKAEGGTGRNIEYFKSQAVIARTYMYKYMNKHLQDGYNLCDNTHCQAYNGLSSDAALNLAAIETKDQVILDKDSTLIFSAFHSNCGGETLSSEDVWLTDMPYLKKVNDPYCLASRNAVWQKSMSLSEWLGYLNKSGYNGNPDDSSVFSFTQQSRANYYEIGNFKIPLAAIRKDLNLRSTFFSVVKAGDTITLKGKGYGHGVGLCQEGAMVMAAKGIEYLKIIDFYYSGVMVTDIKNAVTLPVLLPPIPPKGGLKPD